MSSYMYEDYRRLYGTRRKSKDYKLIFRSCHLRLEGYDFAIRHRRNEDLVFTISPSNWVTLHGDGKNMTNRNLMSLGIGDTPIYSDMSAHRNKVHTTRLHANGKSNPYAPGIQVKLHHGQAIEFTNFPVDMSRVVTNEAKNAVKDETTKIRKLTKVMARMGVFDKIAHGALGNWWKGGIRSVEGINYKDPVGSDAENLFRVGICHCNPPNHSDHVNGVWTRLSEEQRVAIYKKRAVEAGLRALRKHIYSTKEGSYVHIPVQPKAHRQVP
jgi:hypothetical protein